MIHLPTIASKTRPLSSTHTPLPPDPSDVNSQRKPRPEGEERIADAVHMSPFHLQRIFSEWAGISPKRFLQYVTKEHAKACLLKSQTVLEVSDNLGLSSASRLHDLMITAEAMTPGEIQSGGQGLEIGYGLGESPFGEVLLAWTSLFLLAGGLWLWPAATR